MRLVATNRRRESMGTTAVDLTAAGHAEADVGPCDPLADASPSPARARLRLVAEPVGSYRAGEAGTTADGAAVVSEELTAAVATLADLDIAELDERTIARLLKVIEQARRRLDARACRLAAALTGRRQERARRERPDDPRAAGKAERQTRRELQDELDWTPSQAKRAQELGHGLFDSPQVADAFDGGTLPPSHAKQLSEVLKWLEGDLRDRLEAELLEAAHRQDARTFGRTCRRALAEADHASAMKAEQRRHDRRRGSVVQTDDGMTRLEALTSGIDGETVATAVNAFRRRDAEGESRTPEQATADAVVAMARAALDAGTASRQHGIRPHVIVLTQRESILSRDERGETIGVVDTLFSGPLPAGEGLRVLDDCDVSQLLCDARGIPVEATEGVRSVPIGVVRAVLARDRVCIGDNCDVPAAWCQVMHLDVPFRLQGRLTIDTAALGCDFHHVKLDRFGWKITWRDGRPILHHPARPPKGPAGRAPDGPRDRRRDRLEDRRRDRLEDRFGVRPEERVGEPSGDPPTGQPPDRQRARGSARPPERETDPPRVAPPGAPPRLFGGRDP
jgi:hypothetical protein